MERTALVLKCFFNADHLVFHQKVMSDFRFSKKAPLTILPIPTTRPATMMTIPITMEKAPVLFIVLYTFSPIRTPPTLLLHIVHNMRQ